MRPDFPVLGPCPHFCSRLTSGSCNRSPNARLRVLLLRVDDGLGVEPSTVKSCGNEVEDALVVEMKDLVDKPGTTIGTYLSVLHCILLPFEIRCVF